MCVADPCSRFSVTIWNTFLGSMHCSYYKKYINKILGDFNINFKVNLNVNLNLPQIPVTMSPIITATLYNSPYLKKNLTKDFIMVEDHKPIDIRTASLNNDQFKKAVKNFL